MEKEKKPVRKECDICGKILWGLNEHQADYILAQHQLTHRKREKKK